MINCQDFFNVLKEKEFLFFTGIPDSTFKEWIKFVNDNDGTNLKHMVACNECEAIALAAGYHLATSKIGVVYMQNSGFGKTINPLTSLCDPEVYSIPILLMIGWRGEPGIKDAPQHKKMGKVTTALLDALGIPYSIIEPNISNVKTELDKAELYMKEKKGPYAIILRKNVFEQYQMTKDYSNNHLITREEAIKVIMDELHENDIVVSTTGYTSREVFEYREKNRQDHSRSFYNIGSMGCASSIGLSIALEHPEKIVVTFDGDGALLMQMGSLSTIGTYHPSNLIHIVFDNNIHESTGGQPTNSSSINLLKAAVSSNYEEGSIIRELKALKQAIRSFRKKQGPIMLVVKIKRGSRTNLQRPNKKPQEYKKDLMRYLVEKKY